MFSFNSNSQITNISHNNWKAFISSPMPHIPRNVWYRLLHKKLSTRVNLHRIIPAKIDDDYCQLCKLPETEQHMLFTCIQKQDLWNAAFKKYLSNPKDPSCSSIFEDLSTLRLSKYYILQYHDKFTIYDFFATIIRFIWKAHWQQFFEQTLILDEIAVDQIQKELLKLSAYNYLLFYLQIRLKPKWAYDDLVFIVFVQVRSRNEWKLKTPYGIKSKNVWKERNGDKCKRSLFHTLASLLILILDEIE
ncbi:hypothetical protein G6F57_009747 [Rhizopus arrhizus]|uniref:Reverse transcriptase zinc-binding domain-containing protein n=1 Tax=Rhizopus oryzae TaxID=64495 RepID=A0A9P7BNL8_RHIOR|nr:hypothetical protein G6F30_010297 [Rhizopus arrhizus]KAG1417367.1 hypothetical protein G6F58_005550 [Rhizopus delemar]KAG0978598.1 hypothetical protein G6F29_009205 [Rhizopus arrhizus]KAG0987007.1 hypothetical protein G6F28_010115 [Rhizopus arrhizus]KAG1004003.1 hypothetical protein G6F27_010539 [Rhizopus arrhizus]